jgi:purine-binding chemotaxis protein CheW
MTPSASGDQHLVIFLLDDRRYALPLSAVERVVRRVDVTPLPRAPEIVSGVIDLGGRIVPVVDVRRRFGLQARTARLDDHLLVARVGPRAVALIADSVEGVRRFAPEALTHDVSFAEESPEGVLAMADGLIVVHDLATFLTAAEDRDLERALEARS